MKRIEQRQTIIMGILLTIFFGGMDAYAQPEVCETIFYYNTSGNTAVFIQKLPSVKWAVRMTAPYIPRIDTSFIGFGILKNSGMSVPDTIVVEILDSNPPTFTQLDQDIFSLYPPAGQKDIQDAFYMIELNFQNSSYTLIPNRDYYLAYRFKGPANDSVRVLFKTPAANETRSIVINANGSTTLASTYVNPQIQTTVDLFAETHVCYPFGIPVELQSFTVRYEEGNAVLEWITASESQNYGFEVERVVSTSESGRGKIWQTIGFVPGRGTTNEQQRYYFIDGDPEAARDRHGFVTYRLRQIDVDGTVTRSPVVQLLLDARSPVFSLAQNYPNPCGVSVTGGRTLTSIRYDIPEEGRVTLQVYDLRGTLLDTVVDETRSAGNHTVLFDTRNLPGGTYLYVLKSGGRVATEKMTIVK